jgi:hypothetical protein
MFILNELNLSYGREKNENIIMRGRSEFGDSIEELP